MKKKYTHILLALTLSFAFSACDLDTNPSDRVAPELAFETTKDADKVVNGTWRYMMETFNSYANPGYGAILRAGDAMGSDVAMNTSKYGFNNQYKFTSLYSKVGTGSLSWKIAYNVINNANEIIANVDKAKGKEEDRLRIKAQAYALRGFMYLHLASGYSFSIEKDPNAVCAPIYTVPATDQTIPEAASSVKEVYAQSVADLEEALTLLPANYVRNGKHQIDKAVILGMLSRATLYSRDWTKAKDYSNQVLAINDFLMSENEYKSGFNSVNNGEWLLGHAQSAEQNEVSYQFHFLDITTPGSYYYSFNMDPYFRDKFDNGDYRKTMMYWAADPGKAINAGDYIWMRYAKFKFRSGFEADIVLMRTAEMYLINAEAKARLNDGDALNKLNLLKVARNAQPANGLAGQALIDEIWLERRKELYGEGFSLVDIVRNQQVVERVKYPDTPIDYTYENNDGQSITVKLKPQGHTIIDLPDNSQFIANSKYYLFRIPDKEERENAALYSKYPRLAIYDK